MRVCCSHFAVVALFGLFISSRTHADYTHVNAPPFNEQTHAQILSHVYGGSFNASGAEDVSYTNGSITAERIEDRLSPTVSGGSQDLGTGSEDGTDQTWNANFTIARAEAKFAAFSQNFGYYEGSGVGTSEPPVYHKLFDLTGSGYDVSGEKDLTALAGQTLRWARGGQGRIVSSREVDNTDHVDHMVTYQIHFPASLGASGAGLTTWLIFWEDKFLNEPSDRDFNDLVVEIEATAVVPEPASGAALALAILAGAARRRR